MLVLGSRRSSPGRWTWPAFLHQHAVSGSPLSPPAQPAELGPRSWRRGAAAGHAIERGWLNIYTSSRFSASAADLASPVNGQGVSPDRHARDDGSLSCCSSSPDGFKLRRWEGRAAGCTRLLWTLCPPPEPCVPARASRRGRPVLPPARCSSPGSTPALPPAFGTDTRLRRARGLEPLLVTFPPL